MSVPSGCPYTWLASTLEGAIGLNRTHSYPDAFEVVEPSLYASREEGYGVVGDVAAWLHTLLVNVAPFLFAAILYTRKGGKAHKELGWGWCALVAAVSVLGALKVVGRTDFYGRTTAFEMKVTRFAVALSSSNLLFQGVYAIRIPHRSKEWVYGRWAAFLATASALAYAAKVRVDVGADPLPYLVLLAFNAAHMRPPDKKDPANSALVRHIFGTVIYGSFSMAFAFTHQLFTLYSGVFVQSDFLFLDVATPLYAPFLINATIGLTTVITTAWYAVPAWKEGLCPMAWLKRVRKLDIRGRNQDRARRRFMNALESGAEKRRAANEREGSDSEEEEEYRGSGPRRTYYRGREIDPSTASVRNRRH